MNLRTCHYVEIMTNIFDAHCHIIDKRFPLVENNGYLPPSFNISDYLSAVSGLNVIGGAVVSGSFQVFDQSYLIDALQVLNRDRLKFVGVTQMPVSVTDKELAYLDSVGVRAVRFNVYRGGSENVSELKRFADRIYDRHGWHVELYIGNTGLREISDIIKSLPRVSVDHLGMDKEANEIVLGLVGAGVKLKATGFGRIGFEPISFMKKVYEVNSSALMFGTDLPSTRAETPFSYDDVVAINSAFSQEELHNIYSKNALDFYRINM